MATTMFTNPYDAQIAEQEASRARALESSKIPWYQRGAYEGQMAGEDFGRNLGGMLGMQTAEEVKQGKIEEIMGQYGEGAKSYEQLLAIADDFRSANMLDLWEETMGMADEMKTTKNTMTPDMKNIRDKAQFELGCDINDPAIIRDGKNCYQLATESHLKVKRVGQEETGLIGGVKSFQETIADVRENQKTLRINLLTLGNLKSLVPKIYTGTGQGAVAAWNKIGTVLGFEDATDAQAATEAFRSGGLEVAMQYINATKGAVSDMEMEKFIEASPNLHNTQLGNLFIIEFAIARQKREQKLLSAMNRFSLKHPGATSTQWNIEEDRLLNTEEYDISKKLQKAYDAAKNDPKYTGLTTDVNTVDDASTDIQSQIDNLPPLQ